MERENRRRQREAEEAARQASLEAETAEKNLQIATDTVTVITSRIDAAEESGEGLDNMAEKRRQEREVRILKLIKNFSEIFRLNERNDRQKKLKRLSNESDDKLKNESAEFEAYSLEWTSETKEIAIEVNRTIATETHIRQEAELAETDPNAADAARLEFNLVSS